MGAGDRFAKCRLKRVVISKVSATLDPDICPGQQWALNHMEWGSPGTKKLEPQGASQPGPCLILFSKSVLFFLGRCPHKLWKLQGPPKPGATSDPLP